MRHGKLALLSVVSVVSLFLVGYRPQWREMYTKWCLANQIAIEQAVQLGPASSLPPLDVEVRLEDYRNRLPENFGEIPQCPVYREVGLATHSYLLQVSASGTTVVRCLLHGTRSDPVVVPSDRGLQMLLERAGELRQQRQMRTALVLALVWCFGPWFGLALLGALVGRARLFAWVSRFERVWRSLNLVLVTACIPGYVLAPIPPT
ncbi:MAG TPA: hypothetical protein PKO06_03875, partial [Candidatus Ozemobacteraceae bacterium]|nr:hypothetical protein [Candidatus Ozemobacteraceae bacterium]